MTLFTSFALSFGSLLALQAVIAAWLFRTATAPLWSKIAIPVLIVALGCYAPFAVASMMGYPVTARMADLPAKAELVAFVPHDDDKTVDLWLQSTGVPRSYEIVLTPELKKTLRQAREAQEHGQRAALKKTAKKGKTNPGDPLGIGDDREMYELDASAFSQLPPKE